MFWRVDCQKDSVTFANEVSKKIGSKTKIAARVESDFNKKEVTAASVGLFWRRDYILAAIIQSFDVAGAKAAGTCPLNSSNF